MESDPANEEGLAGLDCSSESNNHQSKGSFRQNQASRVFGCVYVCVCVRNANVLTEQIAGNFPSPPECCGFDERLHNNVGFAEAIENILSACET